MQGEIDPAALADVVLRDDVIATKTVLFRKAGVIAPEGEVLRALERDHREMEASGIFGGEDSTFSDILVTLRRVQEQLGREASAEPGEVPGTA